MQINNNLRLVILVLILAFIQIVINAGGIIYIDCVGAVLIAILVNGNYPLKTLMLCALFADLIGHWYLGTHLLAAILIGFLIAPLINFYRMSNLIQRNILNCIFYAILLGIVTLVGVLTHNVIFKWSNFFINVFIVCPIVLSLFNLVAFKSRSNVFY